MFPLIREVSWLSSGDTWKCSPSGRVSLGEGWAEVTQEQRWQNLWCASVPCVCFSLAYFVYAHIFSSVCLHICEQVLLQTRESMWGLETDIKLLPQFLPSFFFLFLFFFFLYRDPHLISSLLTRLDCLANEPPGFPCPCSSALRLHTHTTFLALLWCWCLNSGPCASTVKTSLTELSV